MKRLGLIYGLLGLLCMPLSAQGTDIIIVGQVVSAADLEPIENANVWFENMPTIGTTTNAEGYYVLRAPNRQNAVVFSAVGYKRRTIRLDRNKRDQAVNVALLEANNVMDELVVVPDKQHTLSIMNEVRKHRRPNNPDNFTDVVYEQQVNRRVFLTNVRQRFFQRRLFRELQHGAIAQDDSNYIVPLYNSIQFIQCAKTSDDVIETELHKREHTLKIVPENVALQLLNDAFLRVNFYHNTITLFQRNLISPLANQGNLYYDYFLYDSIAPDSTRFYRIHFRPKNDKTLAFRGKMWIDAQSFALQKIEATLPLTANINYVNNLQIKQTFKRIDSVRYFYQTSDQALGLRLNLTTDTNQRYFAAIIDEHTNFSMPRPLHDADTANMVPQNISDTTNRDSAFNAAIDTLNNTRMQRWVNTLVDLSLNGYLHVWKFDLGPVANLISFNRLEGFRPALSLRTGEQFCDFFTVGGYGGYGFRDRRWKYGGELQFRWGPQHAHTLGAFYDNDVLRYGYQSLKLINDNKVGNGENIFPQFLANKIYTKFVYEQKVSLRYTYEQKGFRLNTAAQISQFSDNRFVLFLQEQAFYRYLTNYAMQIGIRLSFRETTLDNFFHRYYWHSHFPVINFQTELGHYQAGLIQGNYARFLLTVNQFVPLTFGELWYTFESGCIVGDVPFPLLNMSYTRRSMWYDIYNFNLVNPAEFITDTYVTAHVHYYTSGWFFNLIPVIKRANLREELICKITYGGLRNGHDRIFKIPPHRTFTVPYVEAGVGITNILRVLSLEFMWRVTYRDVPDATRFGVGLRFDIGF